MRNRAYYRDPFLESMEAKVVSCLPKNGQFHVTLDQTLFFPEGGGQPADSGWIDGKKILHVYEKDRAVYHVIGEPITKKNVNCTLNMERRRYHMQHHTGQHLLSAVLLNHFGLETKGFHLGKDFTTIDIDTPTESFSFKDAESRVNDLIQADIAVKSYFADNTNLSTLPMRKEPQVDEDIRIVEISGIDYSACCGTHLTSTGQIGLLKILKTEKYKKLTRIYFLCGKRAFTDYGAKHTLVTTLCNLFSSSQEDLLQRIEGQFLLIDRLNAENKMIEEELFELRAKQLVEETKGEIITVNLGDKPFESAQGLARQICELGRFVAAISVGQRLVLAHNGEFALHCGEYIKENVPKYSGRGGGSKTFAQAFFENPAEVEKFLEHLLKNGGLHQ